MHRTALAALAFGLALTACGKDLENPDFPTTLACALDKANCNKPAAAPAAAKPTNPPASVVRPSP